MAFKIRTFDKPSYEEESETPARLIIISCEGCVTEPEYFNTVSKKLDDHISSIVKVEIVDKETTASEPKDILNNLNSYIDKYGCNNKYDSVWLVCDREKVEARRRNIEAIKPECDEGGFKIALSNPTFELWLLMHLVDISNYDEVEIFENKKVFKSKSSRRYLDKELSNLLGNGFNKKVGRFNQDIVSFENIMRAMSQASLFSTEFDDILDNIGTNLAKLMSDILDN